MLATYHNHSNWSDGQTPPEDLFHAASVMQIHELGISDHWVLHPQAIQQKWAMPTDALGDYVDALLAVREVSKQRKGPAVRLGVEVDWFPGHSQPLREALGRYPFDYIIGSVHEVNIAGVGRFTIDGSPAAWEKITPQQRDEVHRQYWLNIATLAQSGVFDIVAHIDLPKKFAYYPTIDLKREITDALDAIAAADHLVVELNTAGWHKPCNDGYPTLDILKACRQRDIPVTISADAHQPEHLLRDFDRAARRLADAGYSSVARFNQREMRLEPLTEAVPR